MPSTRASRTLTPRQVIDRIMEVIAALPEEVQDLPEKLRSRRQWEQLLGPQNPRGAQVMSVLRELPAFTNQAPSGARPSKAAWARVFSRHMGAEQVRGMLLEWYAIASVTPAKRPRIVSWRDAFGPQEIVQRVRPVEHDDYIHNPHRGTTTFQRFQGEDTYPASITSDTHGPVSFPRRRIVDNVKYIPRTTLTYCRWPWKWLEPEKGRFDWGIVDGTLRAARASGQSAQLRFQPYTIRWDTDAHPPKAKRYPPGSSVNLPDWYWDTGAKWIHQGHFARNEPDSNDPLYLKHFGDFIRAFAKRYDGHPDLESIDIAYAGFWGEAGGNATTRTAAKLADIYIASFKKTQLLGMLGTPACRRALDRGYNLGWRADCFGDLSRAEVPEVPRHLCFNHTYDVYVQEIHRCGLKEAWKTAPVTMETCGNVATWMMSGYDLDEIIEEGYKYHMSVFMPKNAFFPEAALDKLTAFDRRIGYRFALRQMLLPLEARRGERLKVELYADNVGCAPIYRPYRLALRLSQGRTVKIVPFAEDIRTWLPGHNFFEEAIVLPKGFERGEVKIALGIIDDADIPRVWFAIAGPTDAGWHPLTSITAT